MVQRCLMCAQWIPKDKPCPHCGGPDRCAANYDPAFDAPLVQALNLPDYGQVIEIQRIFDLKP